MHGQTGSADSHKPRVLFVGAFPPNGYTLAGGNITDCYLLMATSFAHRLKIRTIDSTQLSQPPPALATRLCSAVKRLKEFRHALNEFKPDAAMIFASAGGSFFEKGLMTRWASKRGRPVLLSVRSGHFMEQSRRSAIFRFLASYVLRYPTFLLCQSKRWQQFYGLTFGIDKERCVIVENWSASVELLRLPLKGSSAQEGEPLTVLYLGWIERFKGVFDLLESVCQLMADPSVPRFRLVMAGSGGALAEAKCWTLAHGLDKDVEFTGWVTREMRLDLFARSDIFVLPSHTEALPNAMIEAMAAGKPVVVTPVGGIPDVIRNGENGLVVPVGDQKRLGEALLRLLRDPRLRQQLAKEARKDAWERFQPEKAAALLLSLIRQAAGEDGGKGMEEDGPASEK